MSDKKTPQEIVDEHDKEKRIGDETIILQEAKSATNGDSANTQLIGRIRLWQVKETIKQGELLRSIVDYMDLLQPKADCVDAHKPKTWPVRLFGMAYSVPVTSAVFVIGFMAFMFCRKQGWI